MLAGKSLMITGGTGSFGTTVLNRFLQTDIREIVIFSRDEKKQEDLRIALNSPKVRFHIGDVRDFDSVSRAMVGVDYVFHAAALKQVPSCEFFPMESVLTNIHGTENVLNAAIDRGVKRVVVLSTDKAVYPINAMGISKAMAEKLLIAKSRMVPSGGTVICATRYGNVMASRGSVIPLFVEKLKAGHPLTITDPNMTRFLMSLDEAIDLVLYAFSTANPGDLFVRKAPGATVKILADGIASIMGKSPKVNLIGTRHGEKQHETLMSHEESQIALDEGDYFRVPTDIRGLNYEKYFETGEENFQSRTSYTSENTNQLSVQQVASLLENLPEFLSLRGQS